MISDPYDAVGCAAVVVGPVCIVTTTSVCVVAWLLGVHPGYIVAIAVSGLAITVALIAWLAEAMS